MPTCSIRWIAMGTDGTGAVTAFATTHFVMHGGGPPECASAWSDASVVPGTASVARIGGGRCRSVVVSVAGWSAFSRAWLWPAMGATWQGASCTWWTCLRWRRGCSWWGAPWRYWRVSCRAWCGCGFSRVRRMVITTHAWECFSRRRPSGHGRSAPRGTTVHATLRHRVSRCSSDMGFGGNPRGRNAHRLALIVRHPARSNGSRVTPRDSRHARTANSRLEAVRS